MELNIFKDKAFKHVKRVIGFIDTDEKSSTFGCADRYFWHYKLHDYYNARMQETSLLLAFFYLEPNSFLYKNEKLLQLIKGIIEFWIENLNKNGSANEIYPHEQSFCATAFTAYIITETLVLLKLKEEISLYQSKLTKIGSWLVNNGNWHIANQMAASAVALYNLNKLTSRDLFINEVNKRVNFLIEECKKNNYFSEYGGFDLGYNTITMSCLARLYQKTKDEAIENILGQSAEDIAKYIDDLGRYDNQEMSRQTQFIYPFSFKVIGSPILEKIKRGLEQDAILNPDWLDDRYVVGLSNDYLMAYYF